MSGSEAVTEEDNALTLAMRDPESSVYQEVTRQLLLRQHQPRWRHARHTDTSKVNLVFGERNGLKYSRLGHEAGVRQLVNYYRGAHVICRKAELVRTLKEAAGSCQSADVSAWHPASFVVYPLPQGGSDSVHTDPDHESGTRSLQQLKEASRRRKDERQDFRRAYANTRDAGGGSVWIAKATHGAKGEGIKISDDAKELITYIDSQKYVHVIQKYIERPLLLDGDRKFDIRCWVLLDGNYDIFLFEEGVLRTASETYHPQHLDDVTSHLTNHCIQETLSANFGAYETGNEMFFDKFDRFMKEKFQISLEDSLMPQIRRIIKDVLHAVAEQLDTRNLLYKSFQLFGFDFLVDADLKVWLLEVNGSPACAEKLLRRLVSSLIQTAVDPVFPPLSEERAQQTTSEFIKIS